MTQKETVLHHLQTNGSLTQKQASEQYGIWRLSNLIYVLKKDGFNSKTIDTPVQNRYGGVSWVATYQMES